MSRYFDDFNTNDEILHYGVKGMKWRKRKIKTSYWPGARKSDIGDITLTPDKQDVKRYKKSKKVGRPSGRVRYKHQGIHRLLDRLEVLPDDYEFNLKRKGKAGVRKRKR